MAKDVTISARVPAAVEEGLADLDAGRVVEHEEILADAARRRRRPAA